MVVVVCKGLYRAHWRDDEHFKSREDQVPARDPSLPSCHRGLDVCTFMELHRPHGFAWCLNMTVSPPAGPQAFYSVNREAARQGCRLLSQAGIPLDARDT